MSKLLVKNKKAYFDYEILEEFEAGIKLIGPEVKSIRAHHISLKGSYISVQNGVCYLKNASISKYAFASLKDYDPLRDRLLLLKKKEIERIEMKLNEQGVTAIPLNIHLSNNFIKLQLGIGRGKKKYDKREDLKRKAVNREIQKTIKKLKY